MDSSAVENPLVSSNKNSDSQLEVQLHPLVILTVSDYITRHSLRRQKGPIVGAVLGAQHGRDITMEQAFECKVKQTQEGRVVLDEDWFSDRLQQYKDVHKSPQLDLVGWFTLTPASGPQSVHLAIHQQLLEQYNESALLLAFHSSSLIDGTTKGSKLPITLYETAFETASDGVDKHMRSPGETGPQLVLRFKEVPYTVETGEAEMIAVDFVAKGAANAVVTNDVSVAKGPPTTQTNAKGKAKGASREIEATGLDLDLLSPEDEELIASLSTKANAIRMLQQRIGLTKAYIDSIPPSYLNTPQSGTEPVNVEPNPQISHTILRSISSTLSRLPLLTPPPENHPTSIDQRHSSTFARESAQQKSDVALTTLLGAMGSTLKSAQDMGRKVAVLERARLQATHMQNALGGGAKGKAGGSYPLRGGATGEFIEPADMSAYTPPMELSAGDEGYVDDYEPDDLDGPSMSHGGGGPLPFGDGSGGALRGKGKGLFRGLRRRQDEDEEMT